MVEREPPGSPFALNQKKLSETFLSKVPAARRKDFFDEREPPRYSRSALGRAAPFQIARTLMCQKNSPKEQLVDGVPPPPGRKSRRQE